MIYLIVVQQQVEEGTEVEEQEIKGEVTMARTRYVLEITHSGGRKEYRKSYDYGRLADAREKIERKKSVRDTHMTREFTR